MQLKSYNKLQIDFKLMLLKLIENYSTQFYSKSISYASMGYDHGAIPSTLSHAKMGCKSLATRSHYIAFRCT